MHYGGRGAGAAGRRSSVEMPVDVDLEAASVEQQQQQQGSAPPTSARMEFFTKSSRANSGVPAQQHLSNAVTGSGGGELGSGEQQQQSFFTRVMSVGRLSRGNSVKDPENNRMNTLV